MGYSSQPGHIFVRTQSVFGTYAADMGSAGVGVKLRSGSLGPSRELMIPDPEIGGNRDIPDAYLGASSWSGDYEFYARLDALTTFLKGALGVSSSATVTGVNTHTITPADTAQLPYISIEEKIGAGLETYNYTDAVVNTLHLEAEANGYLMGTAGIIAVKQIAGATPGTNAYDETPLVVGTNITVTYNGVSLPAKSFSLDINNNFEDDDFRLGSFYLGSLDPKRREVTASFGIRESSSALWRQAVYGTSAATAVGGVSTKQQLIITMSSFETIPSSTPPTAYSLTITIPKYALTPYSLSASGDDVIDSDIGGQALRPATGTGLLTAVVKNGQAAIP